MALTKVTGSGADGLTLSSTDVTVASGDLLFGTANKGVVLGVTSNTDGNTLEDYEEGTWSPTHDSGAGTGSFSNALYTKIGRQVHIALSFAFSGASAGLVIGNLPFVANNHAAGIGREDATNGYSIHTMTTVSTSTINVRGNQATGNPSAYAVSSGTFRISFTYTTSS